MRSRRARREKIEDSRTESSDVRGEGENVEVDAGLVQKRSGIRLIAADIFYGAFIEH
jgi:hypothetical protein